MASSIKFIFIIVLQFESVLTTCMEHDNQVHRYLISTEPPYDNYYNISKAVYPSVDLPSLLIDIAVTFLATTDNTTSTQSGSLPTNVNESTASPRPTATNSIRTYKWSMSCLYVSGGNISLSSMNIFSLGAIWPNRRARKLYITLPQFCSGTPSDPHQHDTMIYFLSTLQDIAVVRSLHDPRINTAECVIAGHEKASTFSGMKQLLHGVCWSLLFISLVMSMFVSQSIIVQLKKWAKDTDKEQQNWSKIAAVMVLSLSVFIVGFSLNIYAWSLSTVKQDLYVPIFFGFVLLVFFRRAFWCIVIHCRNNSTRSVKECFCIFDWNFTSGHGEDTSKNFVSCFLLYPAVFMAFHHLLWILLGVITEPFWGITILVAIICISAAFCVLVCEFHKAYCSPAERPNSPLRGEREKKKKTIIMIVMIVMSVILFLCAFIAFVLLMLILLVVAQAFLSESLISAIVQNGVVTVVTVWLGYLKLRAGNGVAAAAAAAAAVAALKGGGGGGGGSSIKEEKGCALKHQDSIHLMSLNHDS